MTQSFIFIDRRRGNDRRRDDDPCRDLPVDLFHRKRRKSADRRDSTRTLSEDYYAFIGASLHAVESVENNPARN